MWRSNETYSTILIKYEYKSKFLRKFQAFNKYLTNTGSLPENIQKKDELRVSYLPAMKSNIKNLMHNCHFKIELVHLYSITKISEIFPAFIFVSRSQQ